MYRQYLLLPLLLLVSACTQPPESAAAAVTISSQYVRAVPPGQPNSLIYMGLHNAAPVDYSLVAVEGDIAQLVELHNHIREDGMLKMRQIEQVVIPAGGEVQLKPGGMHVMLMGLNRELQLGEEIGVTLIFNDGSQIEIKAPVQKPKLRMIDYDD